MAHYQDFEDRHIGPSHAQEAQMLQVLGYPDLKTFIKAVVPANIAIQKPLSQTLPAQLL
jgi:glycine dehydrogenase